MALKLHFDDWQWKSLFLHFDILDISTWQRSLGTGAVIGRPQPWPSNMKQARGQGGSSYLGRLHRPSKGKDRSLQVEGAMSPE
jgi:hypothetical protein